MALCSVLGRRALCAFAGALALLAICASIGHAATTCDKYASPTGSDNSGDGSSSNPYQTVNQLDAALRPGETGCLRAGTYGDQSTWYKINTNGTPSGQITITAYPGEHVKVIGWIDMEASYTTISGLEIDGSNTFYNQDRPGIPCRSHGISDGLAIAGSNDIVEGNDYYQSNPGTRSVGIGIGWWGHPDNTIIRNNRIHDVGQCQDYDHIIYLANGRNVQIYGNWMWNDHHGWGVQVYPGASHAHIFDNVIDSAGSGFVVGGSSATSDNRIDHNVVMNSTGLAKAGLHGVAISDYWDAAPGTNNTFTSNDSYGNPQGIARVSAIHTSGNITNAPDFVDSAAHDYRVQPGSPLASWGLWDGVVPGASQPARPASADRVAHAAVLHRSRHHRARARVRTGHHHRHRAHRRSTAAPVFAVTAAR